MAKATKAQSEETAARVLRTAHGMFAERGYAGVGLEDVAEAAGVTRGAVYHHFRNKLGLFTAVHSCVQAAVASAIDSATAGVDDAWQQLEIGCRTFLAASVSDDNRRIMLIDAPAVLGWATWQQADDANSERMLAAGISELAEAGVISVPSVAATSALLSGAMNEAAMWIAGANDRTAALEHAWETLALMLSGLRAD